MIRSTIESYNIPDLMLEGLNFKDVQFTILTSITLSFFIATFVLEARFPSQVTIKLLKSSFATACKCRLKNR